MKLLIDTHVLLWLFDDYERIPEPIRLELEEPSNDVYVSCMSAYEIAYKHHLGKLPIAETLLPNYDGFLIQLQVEEIPLYGRHARVAGLLPGNHRDPFDRMIVAQSIVEGLTVVSSDHALDSLGIQRYW